ncbi:MAG: sigma-70 family RNA polymerase sigma factor [Bacteroidota bacterium]|nr:sigma-70 family RNA polymerase sigma factor [Bacteroidota bacterium]
MYNEEQIIKDCIQNKAEAQFKLYKHYASKMYGICLRFAKISNEGDDILQEAFIKVFENLKNFRNEGSFEGWIKRIVVNTAINYVKKNAIYYQDENIDNIGEIEIEENEAVSNISQNELINLIQQLPDGKRIVFNLYEIEGYSHKQIAETLNISENTSKSQLAKAKIILRDKIEKINNKTKELIIDK